MTTCMGKSCSFGLLCVSFMGVCQTLCVSFPFWTWVLFVLIPDHCLSIYSESGVIPKNAQNGPS